MPTIEQDLAGDDPPGAGVGPTRAHRVADRTTAGFRPIVRGDAAADDRSVTTSLPSLVSMLRRWRSAGGWWPIVLVTSALAAAVVVYVDLPAPIRPAIVLWFVAVCPGMALVGLLDFREPAARYTLAVTLSLSLAALFAAISLYAGFWSPDAVLACLIVVTVVGAIAQSANAVRSAERRRSAAAPRRSTQLVAPLLRPDATAVRPIAAESSATPDAGEFAPEPAAPIAPRPPRRPTELTDAEWEAVAPFVPRRRAKDRYDPRDLTNAVLYILDADADWTALTGEFPPPPIVRRFYWRLRRAGSWAAIEATLGRGHRRRRGDPPTRKRHPPPPPAANEPNRSV